MLETSKSLLSRHRAHVARCIATITIVNHAETRKSVKISFEISTLKPRKVMVQFNTNAIKTLDLKPGGLTTVGPFTVNLLNGKNPLSFETDVPADFPGNGDPRRLSFGISNLIVEEPTIPDGAKIGY